MKIYSIFKNVIGSLLNILLVNDSEPQGKPWLIPMLTPLCREEKHRGIEMLADQTHMTSVFV